MPTGPEHYLQSELILSEVSLSSPKQTNSPLLAALHAQNLLLAALVHSVQGLAAAVASQASVVYTSGMSPADYNAWSQAASADPVDADTEEINEDDR